MVGVSGAPLPAPDPMAGPGTEEAQEATPPKEVPTLGTIGALARVVTALAHGQRVPIQSGLLPWIVI